MKVHELCLTLHEYVDARLALLGQQVANFFQKHFLARWRSRCSFLFLFLHAVHALDNKEHDERNDDERDQRGDECA